MATAEEALYHYLPVPAHRKLYFTAIARQYNERCALVLLSLVVLQAPKRRNSFQHTKNGENEKD